MVSTRLAGVELWPWPRNQSCGLVGVGESRKRGVSATRCAQGAISDRLESSEGAAEFQLGVLGFQNPEMPVVGSRRSLLI